MSNIFQKIMQRIALKHVDDERNKKYTSLDESKLIGLVFNANEPGMEESMEKVREILGKKKKGYFAISVDLSEEITDAHKSLLSNPHIFHVHRTDLNWYELPNENIISEFTSKKADIMIDMTASGSSRIFPVNYFMKMSKAGLKVATCPTDYPMYDMVFKEAPKDQPAKKGEVHVSSIEDIFRYLEIIKSE